MKKPIILTVDDDLQVLNAIVRDLRSRYKKEYRILSSTDPQEALDSIRELKKKGEHIALFVSDHKMPILAGVDFLEQARALEPNAKRVLLTAYSDTDAAIKAINEVQLDYYLLKPWDPPEEKMYPVLDDLLDEWQSGFHPEFDGLRVIGIQYSPATHVIKDFLAGNLFPFRWLDYDSNEKAKEICELHHLEVSDLPVVIHQNKVYKKPSIQDVATILGLPSKPSSELYDVVIVGAGPAGLAAAVYGGSEGLKTLLIEKRAPGGQAGTSSRIENYLGFPKGLSGAELSRRAMTQATRFGVEFLSPKIVKKITTKDNYKILELEDGTEIFTKSVIVTTGVEYRKLEVPNLMQYTGAGVYYGAATTEAGSTKGKDVFIVGGGNSAGQAAVYLSQFAKKVVILIRKPDLTSSMSSYLIDQLDAIDNIEVWGRHQVKRVEGDDEKLTHVVVENLDTNEEGLLEAGALFIFIGARPHTEWLGGMLFTDEKGYVTTGRDLSLNQDFRKTWKLNRDPFILETCRPGVFAAGDVRSGAMNRVASAVGEGSMAISLVHQYLEEV